MSMICRKCDRPGTFFVRKEYCYCNECFISTINHKFRACIGKNKTLSSNEKVLICLSGDASSTVLLDLIYIGISLNNHKKLRVVPYFLHIIEIELEDEIVPNLIREQCKNYNFDITVVHINDHNQHLKISKNIFSNTPTSISQDVLTKIKQNIYVKIAKELECHTVFTAETTTILATKLLSNIAIGRGSQIENNVGFADKRGDVKILRPMRDITNEEIDQYIRIKDLKPAKTMHETAYETSLQSVIKKFVIDLQDNYPATVSTVCKTADKIGSVNNNINKKKCVMCQSNLDCNKLNLTAVDATMFSRKMSLRGVTSYDNENIQLTEEEDNLMFPFIYQTLCYCCSRNMSQLNDPMLHALVSKNDEK